MKINVIGRAGLMNRAVATLSSLKADFDGG